jgi:hypothetical protein
VDVPQLCSCVVVLLICYGIQSPLAGLRLLLALLRFGTSVVYRTGAMMAGAELALGVNLVE